MKVLAIIPTYNEADILPGVLRHLHSQGVDTYVIDNWSTDGTKNLAHEAGVEAAVNFSQDLRLVRAESFRPPAPSTSISGPGS